MLVYIETHPLLTDRFTGIPQLTWHMANYWLEQTDHKVKFFTGAVELDTDVVRDILRIRSGRYFQVLHRGGARATRPLQASEVRSAIGLFPHTRHLKGKTFAREIQIVHDLTALLLPEMHPSELVRSEGYTNDQYDDLDHIISVSELTRDDLMTYCKIDRRKITVAYPGVAWFKTHISSYDYLKTARFGKYVVILGTFEPRKNIDVVFEYLKKYPDILQEYLFCFCGNPGWGDVYDRLTGDSEFQNAVKSDRVRLVSFVDEQLKFVLLREASFLIYPSFYEGFGSPVAEALSVGLPTVVSIGGSLPEVAGDVGYYFEPSDVESLAKAVSRVRYDLSFRNAETRLAAFKRGMKFSWLEFNKKVHEVVNQLG